MALWAGRFKKEINENVNAFNSSISFDARMYKHDIMGSIAHASMLCKQGIIDEKSLKDILTGLDEILNDLETGKLLFDPNAEDIHMFIESELTKKYPVSGKKLHTARSRNDQVALDLRLYTRDEMKDIKQMLIDLINVIIEQSLQHTETIMCGYTHLQRAQPITFAHHLMAYAQMFYRDITRIDDCYERMNVSPLGSGALATTTYPIDREFVAQQLGMSGICENSLDGVSDRDYAIEFANALALIMMHLSRFSEEMILWCSWEFKYIELDDAYATGSSIMPQKKNPDIAELVRGKSARVINHVSSLLTMMKGLPLAYNKDMQEDKEALFDAIDQVKLCLPVFTDMLKTMKVNTQKMREFAAKGFINATDCADYLVKHGKAFRDAYKTTGELVAYCIDHDLVLETLPLEVYQAHDKAFDKDIYEAIALETCVNNRVVDGGPSPEAVKKQIQKMQKKVGALS
ncbi:argininosuccinate lyase [Longibaculum muris]|uniref:Argininosuccinate lyase n=1 Tax=Longibaculum muris TaxID=1796628 RepID=A0A4R3Z4A3_9FIRM|nr:argininosuccinate lyase [Longibaculum muris]KXU49924.1 argininosuccinate lyase [Candidatus Stoquefichus sp. KLE1796]MBS5368109.1 argininosuccinate lyase [Coprobacillus cateniformis]MCR1887523.1 argininosuccinate lyase [Longibaculum muris]MED9811759.1 argininosuccinate lyase [Longibaculum muris]TCW00759.1 argininosuccinate lyase [Longibaculum muris]